MKDDQLYIDLYVQWKRLMSQNAQANRECCNRLSMEIRELKTYGQVSKEAIQLAPYVPWR